MKNYFSSSFRFTTNLRKRHRDFAYTPYFNTRTDSPFPSTPHQRRVLVTMDASTLKYYHHPKPTVYIAVHAGVAWSVDMDKCAMACVHLYDITQCLH